ncbi:hypothetical protein [Streptomyces sp. NBC_01429]|uniref:hypothetical protein n=1 Tax=Streptomyces sp. NBC_01429 TaxID=2903862 RepID=UPI002E295C98|nr:hypothetical protein [Streptomyces sp. NBC_01429]
MREIDGDEGNGLVRMVRRCAASVVAWWMAQMVLPSTPGVDFASRPTPLRPGPCSGRSGVGRFA